MSSEINTYMPDRIKVTEFNAVYNSLTPPVYFHILFMLVDWHTRRIVLFLFYSTLA